MKHLLIKWLDGVSILGLCAFALIGGFSAGLLVQELPIFCLTLTLVALVPLLIGEAL